MDRGKRGAPAPHGAVDSTALVSFTFLWFLQTTVLAQQRNITCIVFKVASDVSPDVQLILFRSKSSVSVIKSTLSFHDIHVPEKNVHHFIFQITPSKVNRLMSNFLRN